MLSLILASILLTLNAGFHLKPIVNEAMIGEQTYFDCITSTTHTNAVHWYHYRVGAKDHEDICIYCLGQVHPQYKSRFEVERILGTDIYRLAIISVQWNDVGIYICQDNGGIGDSLSAQLVVLESAPICQTNMKSDGLLGLNDCNMEPDVLQMSCSVSYRGNIRPTIQWREVRSSDPMKRGVFCNDSDHQMTCNLVLNASLSLNGSSYVCETTTSATTKYKCSLGAINVMHVNINNSLMEMDFDKIEPIRCLANSSQSCSYSWMWIDGVHKEIVSYGAVLTPSKAGWHKCEAKCAIRGKRCSVLSRLVRVSEQTETPPIITYLVPIIGIISFILVIVAVIRSSAKRRRNRM